LVGWLVCVCVRGRTSELTAAHKAFLGEREVRDVSYVCKRTCDGGEPVRCGARPRMTDGEGERSRSHRSSRQLCGSGNGERCFLFGGVLIA